MKWKQKLSTVQLVSLCIASNARTSCRMSSPTFMGDEREQTEGKKLNGNIFRGSKVTGREGTDKLF